MSNFTTYFKIVFYKVYGIKEKAVHIEKFYTDENKNKYD